MRYQLRVDPGTDRAVIERVHDFHAEHCPVARSISGCIGITTEVEVAEEGAE